MTGGDTDGDPGREDGREDGHEHANRVVAPETDRITIVDADGTMSDPDAATNIDEPRLPRSSASPPPPPVVGQAPAPLPGTVPTARAYRSPEERNRSVHRRANPWYRRLARGLVALCVIGALGLGVYVGARAIQNYVNRDELPSSSPDVPTVRETTILVASTSDALALQGTVSFDTVSGAYEFVGLVGSPNGQDRVTSPDGAEVYILNPDATWNVATGDEAIVGSIERAISALSDATTADTILTNRMRRGYAELVDRTAEGPESDELTRYDVALDLAAFADDYPLQWDTFREEAIPGVAESQSHDTSFWLDDESVLVRVQDADTGWNWERLAYSDSEYLAFRPPPTQVIDPETQAAATGIDCRTEGLDVGWTTTLPTCEEAETVGRELAASVGLADTADSPAAQLAFASVCTTLQGEEPRTFDDPAHLELAGRLVDTGVCPGNTSLVQVTSEG